MPLKPIIIILCLVGLGAVIKPDWSMMFIWAGGMALLWLMTGQWAAPASGAKVEATEEKLTDAEQLRPLDASMEADDIDDLSRLDGQALDQAEGEQQPRS